MFHAGVVTARLDLIDAAVSCAAIHLSAPPIFRVLLHRGGPQVRYLNARWIVARVVNGYTRGNWPIKPLPRIAMSIDTLTDSTITIPTSRPRPDPNKSIARPLSATP